MEFIQKNPGPKECAIVAVYNASLWAGTPVPYDIAKEIAIRKYEFGTKGGGLRSSKITKLLRSCGVPAKVWKRGTPLHLIMYAMYSGKAMYFSYRKKDKKIGHSVLITPDFVVHNGVGKYKQWKNIFYGIVTGQLEFKAWIVGNL